MGVFQNRVLKKVFAPKGQEVTGGCTGDADKSLVRPGRKRATATEDFEVHISYL